VVAFTTKRNWFQFSLIIFVVLLGKIQGVGWWRSVKIPIFDFFLSEWRPPPSWIYKISKFWRYARRRPPSWILNFFIFKWSERWKGSSCVTVPNFVTVCQLVTEIWQCLIFQNGGRRHLGFSDFENFDGLNTQEGQTASPCQILSKSVKLRRDMVIFRFFFQDGGRRHLWFSNFGNFNGRSAQEGQTASPWLFILSAHAGLLVTRACRVVQAVVKGDQDQRATAMPNCHLLIPCDKAYPFNRFLKNLSITRNHAQRLNERMNQKLNWTNLIMSLLCK